MALSADTKLGPYRITDQIGGGGMGEVYRATDTRLDRTVAIKVLRQEMADNRERRERFEREAKAISSLNHPHICTLYDVGEQDGTNFLVMELLDGETLAQRLERGPLPLDQELKSAIEIADALDKAHRHGIVHRDLKPSNIMLTKSGVKLLDFGLAKLKRPEGAPIQGLRDASTDSGITLQGTIQGTLQYMAPEQIHGREADARSDIFAFGALLYEMASGKRAFEGDTYASIIAAILEHEPRALRDVQPSTPPWLESLIMICLAKDPDERFQSAHDIKLQLRQFQGRTPISEGHAAVPQQRRSRSLALPALVILLLTAAAALAFV